MSQCHTESPSPSGGDHCHTPAKRDYILWASSALVLLGLLGHLFIFKEHDAANYLAVYSHGVYELMTEMWIGIVLGIIFVGLLVNAPHRSTYLC